MHSTPRFLQGIFPFEGQGVDKPAPLHEALTLFDEYRITTLFVVDDDKPVGVLHIHDCPAAR